MPFLNNKPLFKSLTTIGSDKSADFHIDSKSVPNVAARLSKNANTMTLVATDKRCPVYVGKKPVLQHTLCHGDEIHIADTIFHFLQELPPQQAKQNTDEGREVKAYLRLLEFSRRLALETQIPELLNALMDEIVAISSAEKGLLVLIEEGAPKIKVARNWRQEALTQSEDALSDSILQKVLLNKSPVVVSDAQSDAEFKSSMSVVSYRLTSVMCVPLIHQANLFGAIYVGNNSFTHAFDQASLEILMVFAAQASLLVQNAFHINALNAEKDSLKASLEYTKFGSIIGSCSGMQTVFRAIDKVAQADISVLITGETGTGKELIARELHRRSNRADGPFVVINCGAIPENLLESELFGHAKGSFTGATGNHIGRFQAAHGGTLFLDEIGEMPLHLQVKILRALQDHCITRVGGTVPEEVDIRIISATHRPLLAMVKESSFREDLYYRLNVVQIDVPPLRERGNDVLVIANYFLQKLAQVYGKSITGLTEEAQNALLNYSWPGNVRQLENRLRRALVMCETNRIGPYDLDIAEDIMANVLPLSAALERFRKQYILDALERNAGNRTKTAKELGVDPRTVFRHLAEQTV